MSNSGLVNYIRISPNKTSPRNRTIKNIVIHHMAGNLTVETCGNVFAPSSRRASSNYGIGSDGRVGMYVEEKDRAWTTGNQIDHSSVTIEVADDVMGNGWHSSDKAMNKLVELCADICRRNGIAKLNYTGGKSGNLLMHKWYQATDCPGAYLESKFPWIASEVNKRLSGNTAKWVHDNVGWWYRRADGSYPKSQWLLLDCYYYFNDKGYALANEWLNYGGNWYWLKDDCRMATGWQYIDKHWYYLNPTGTKNKPVGAMLDGWQYIDGQWYYLRTKAEEGYPHGSMVEGAVTFVDYDYYCREKGTDKNYPVGSMLIGWRSVTETDEDGTKKVKWFWYNKDSNCQPIGSMLKNHWLTTSNGKKYYLKDDGVMACNETMTISEKEYTFDASGALV
jgi:glucan-binding YG repeat protein